MTAGGEDLYVTIHAYGVDDSLAQAAVEREVLKFGAFPTFRQMNQASGSIVLIGYGAPEPPNPFGWDPVGEWRPTLYLVNETSGHSIQSDSGHEIALFSGTEFTNRDVAVIVARWLRGQFGVQSTPDGRSRAAIENLTGYTAALLENGYLKDYIRELKADLKETKGDLTDAQVEARTFATLYEQLKLDNEALKLELSKRTVDTKRSAWRVKVLKATGLALLTSGLPGQVAANEWDRFTHPDEYELQQAQTELPERCDLTINVFQNSDYTFGGEATWQMPIEEVKGSDPIASTIPRAGSSDAPRAPTVTDEDLSRRSDPTDEDFAWPVEEAQTFTLDESRLDEDRLSEVTGEPDVTHRPGDEPNPENDGQPYDEDLDRKR